MPTQIQHKHSLSSVYVDQAGARAVKLLQILLLLGLLMKVSFGQGTYVNLECQCRAAICMHVGLSMNKP